uniref:CCHC-type domain-containing protein n=1 Tax=Cajanus cajan TaxID=3821 RepID=A0A151SGV3_CAJCA|nr:hypothetical protein KK1_000143 [Cajanus cajan]
MEENESIQTMFGRFQTIVNELSFLGRTYDNFDHIDKLLCSLPRKWRPQVTTLRASKNLEKLSLEELIGLFKVHELELQQDDVGRKQKKFNRTPRDKAQPVCFECKKPGHYKIECPELEKEKEKGKKKLIFHKKKKAMMATREDLDTSSSKDDEEANICLMEDTDSSSESDDEEVSKYDFKSLQHAYNQLLSDSAKISTAYKEQKKRISELLEENLLLKNENAKLLKKLEKGFEQCNRTSYEVNMLNKEINLLKSDLSKFTLGTKNLEQILKYSRSSNDKSGIGYIEPKPENESSTSTCSTYGKHEHSTSKCSHMHKKRYSKTSNANTHGPKSIWVRKTEIIPFVDLFNKEKKCPVMILGQWLLATYDGQKVYVPRPQIQERRPSHIRRRAKWTNHGDR